MRRESRIIVSISLTLATTAGVQPQDEGRTYEERVTPGCYCTVTRDR